MEASQKRGKPASPATPAFGLQVHNSAITWRGRQAAECKSQFTNGGIGTSSDTGDSGGFVLEVEARSVRVVVVVVVVVAEI